MCVNLHVFIILVMQVSSSVIDSREFPLLYKDALLG